jgi:hypothetical protein
VKQVNKFLICENAELLKNFPKVIKEENSKTVVISGEKSALTKNKHIDTFIAIKKIAKKDFIDQLIANEKLISKLDGWIIWGNDELMRRVATSNLSLEEKLRILPAKKKIGLQMLGSKVGLAKVSKELNLCAPETIIAKNSKELKKCSHGFTTPFIVKSDRFGGGEFVKKVSTIKERKELNIPKEWFPVVVQDFVLGQLVSVEGFFKDGKLIAWISSSKTSTLGQFGASYSRTYESPRERNFELDLIRLGKECGLNGMFNCTFISKGRKHYLIEADARPNSWHFLFSFFKLPILEIMGERQAIPATPFTINLKNKKVKITDLDRAIPYALSEKNQQVILESIVGISHSTQWLAGKKIKALKILALSIFLLLLTWLPNELLNPIKNLSFTKFIHHKIFER